VVEGVVCIGVPLGPELHQHRTNRCSAAFAIVTKKTHGKDFVVRIGLCRVPGAHGKKRFPRSEASDQSLVDLTCKTLIPLFLSKNEICIHLIKILIT
jgi:hypothetical protein